MSNLTSYLKDLIFTLSCESGYYVNVYDIDYENSRARICVKDTSTGYDRYCTVEKSQLGVYVVRDNDPCKPYMHEKEFLERYAKFMGINIGMPRCVFVFPPYGGAVSAHVMVYDPDTKHFESHYVCVDTREEDYEFVYAETVYSEDPDYVVRRNFKEGTEKKVPKTNKR